MIRPLTLVLVLLAAPLALAADLPDRIVPADSTVSSITNVQITSADINTITYHPATGGPNKTIARDRVKEVSWGDTPNELRLALQHYRLALTYIGRNPQAAQRELQQAIANINACPAAAARGFWYDPFRPLLRARCQVLLEKFDEALTDLDQVTSQFPQSMYFYEAQQEKFPVLIQLKKYNRVAEVAAALDPGEQYKDADSVGPCGKMWQLKVRLAEAQAAVQLDDKSARAKELYTGLIDVTEKLKAQPPAGIKPFLAELSSIREQSVIGSIEYLLKNNTDEAGKAIEKYAPELKDPNIRGRLFSSMGDIFYAEAEKMGEGDVRKKKYTDALYAYMRVYLLFAQAEVRPHAMLRVALISAALGDKTRAKRLAEEVKQQYPDAAETKDATALLTTLGAAPK